MRFMFSDCDSKGLEFGIVETYPDLEWFKCFQRAMSFTRYLINCYYYHGKFLALTRFLKYLVGRYNFF